MDDSIFNIFAPKYRDLIGYLFGVRDMDVSAATVYNNHNYKPESLNELIDTGWVVSDEGYVRLNNELTTLLEGRCGVSGNVTVSRIIELIDEIEETSLNYEERSSEDGRGVDERKLRRDFLSLISQIRSTHRDIKSLVEREIRFEQDVHIKVKQLDSYRIKTDRYKESLDRCLAYVKNSDGLQVSQNATIRRFRGQLNRQIRNSKESAHATGIVILEYIHKVRSDRAFITKLTRLGDLIARKEFQAKTNIDEMLEQDGLDPLFRAEPIRSSLPCDLWESESWIERFVQLADDFSLIKSSKESIVIEEVDFEVKTVFVADPEFILAQFLQQERDLFSFILDFPFGIPDLEEKFEAQLEAYCEIVSSKLGKDLFYEEELSQYRHRGLEYSYIGTYPSEGIGRRKGKVPLTYLSTPS
tara:strand:+ start:417 stop:1658 length:1242 start_codon:yes stop_codon:yes gene_type:complete